MQEGAGRYAFMVKDRKLPFCSNIFCLSWTKLNKFNFGVKFLGPIFQSFFCSRLHFWNFLSTQGPIFKFLLILGLDFFICLLQGKKGGFVPPLGHQKWDVVSTLGSNFNCCTALGKNLCVGPHHFN